MIVALVDRFVNKTFGHTQALRTFFIVLGLMISIRSGIATESWEPSYDAAEAELDRGNAQAAEKLLLNSLRAAENTHASKYSCNGVKFELVRCFLIQDKLTEAEQYLREFKVYLTHAKVAPQTRVTVLNAFGQLYSKQGRPTEAEQMLLQSVGISQKLGDAELIIGSQNNLANAYMQQNKFSRAEPLLKNLVTMTQSRKVPISSSDLYRLQSSLGACYLGEQRYKDCEEELHKALVTYNKSHQHDPGRYANDLAQLAEAIRLQHRPAESVPIFEQSLLSYKETGMKSEIKQTLGNYALALRESGNISKGVQIEREKRNGEHEHGR